MPHYQRVGNVPAKRHTDHRRADGGRYAEEVIGRHGFSGESSVLYHRNSPSAVRGIETASELTAEPSCIETPLRPHHLRAGDVEIATAADPIRGRRTLLRNADVSIGWVAASTESPLYRNVVGDEIVYVQAGSGVVE